MIGAAATLPAFATTTQAQAGNTDISSQITDTLVVPLSTGASLVYLIFDLAGWPMGWNYIIRHFCPVGVEMHSQGFAILPTPGAPALDVNIRNNVRVNNLRNLIGANGEQGFSWYVRNDGASAGPCRLELSFVAKRVV